MSLVEPGKQREKSWEASVIFVLGCHCFEFYEHIDKIAHDKRKGGNSHKENKGRYQPFTVAYRMQFTVANWG